MVNELTQVSEVTVTYTPNFKAKERPKITTSKQAYQIFLNCWNIDKIELQEELKVLLLNRENRVLGIADVSVGGIDGTVVDPKMIFAIALKGKASSIILAHNHPSGNLRLSEADKLVTGKLVKAGMLLELPIVDHLIISKDGYTSCGDERLI